jgi:hypothetical protein
MVIIYTIRDVLGIAAELTASEFDAPATIHH